MITLRRMPLVSFCGWCEQWANGRRWYSELGLCPKCHARFVKEARMWIAERARRFVAA